MSTSYKTTVLLAMIALFAFACQCAFNMTLSHLLSNGMYGNLSIGLQTLSFFSLVILLGTSAADENFFSKYLQENNYSSAYDYARWSFREVFINSKWYMIGLLLLAAVMIILDQSNVKDLKSYHITFYLLFTAPLVALTSLIVSALQCNRNLITYSLSNQCAWYIVYTLVIGSVYYSYHPAMDNHILILITIRAMLILIVIDLIACFIKIPRKFFVSVFDSKKSPIISSTQWRTTSVQLFIQQVLCSLIGISGIYAVKFFTTGYLAIDQYSALISIDNILWILVISIFSGLAPNVSSYVGNKNTLGLQRIVNRCNFTLFLTTTVIMFVMVYFGRDILGLFGSRYVTQDSYVALNILLAGCYIENFGYAPFVLLAFSNNQKLTIYIFLGQLVMLLITAIILTIYLGIIGTALATTLSAITATIVFNVIARKKTHIKSLTFA